MTTDKSVRNYCIECKRYTNHEIKRTISKNHGHTHDGEAQFSIEYSIVECKGCEEISFRHVRYDLEGVYLDHNDEWIVPEEVQNFPKPPKGNIDTKYLPDIVKNIYQETCNAYRDGALTLAGIGFRATIEAICNDQKIPGDQLNVKISNLANKGLLSKKDSSRLHSIRFMGNDAVHDTKKPLKKSLRAALIIVEHLITTVYIIDKESSGKLDLIIEDYSKFERLLNEKIAEFSEGDEYPLEKFLGKDIRLISESKKKINDRLNEKIGKGEYKKLAFGKKGKYPNSKVDLQYYIVT